MCPKWKRQTLALLSAGTSYSFSSPDFPSTGPRKETSGLGLGNPLLVLGQGGQNPRKFQNNAGGLEDLPQAYALRFSFSFFIAENQFSHPSTTRCCFREVLAEKGHRPELQISGEGKRAQQPSPVWAAEEELRGRESRSGRSKEGPAERAERRARRRAGRALARGSRAPTPPHLKCRTSLREGAGAARQGAGASHANEGRGVAWRAGR